MTRKWSRIGPVQARSGLWVALAETSCGRFILRGHGASRTAALERLQAEIRAFDAMDDSDGEAPPSASN